MIFTPCFICEYIEITCITHPIVQIACITFSIGCVIHAHMYTVLYMYKTYIIYMLFYIWIHSNRMYYAPYRECSTCDLYDRVCKTCVHIQITCITHPIENVFSFLHNLLQHTATYGLQHTATNCNGMQRALQHTAARCC